MGVRMTKAETYVLALLVVLLASTSSAVAQEKNEPTIYNEDVKIARFVDAAYPDAARRARVAGFVVVRIDLNDQGSVTGAVALSGPRLPVPASVENARKWQFQQNLR